MLACRRWNAARSCCAVTEAELGRAADSLAKQFTGDTIMDTVEKILREALAAAIRPSGAVLIAVGFIIGAVVL